MNDWLTDWLTGWLAGWLADWLAGWLAHSLTHSFTYLERMGKTIITVAYPKQEIVVFINPYNFNFVVFSLLI